MSEPWIRLHANIGDKKVVWRLVTRLDVTRTTAVGLLAMLWGAVSQYAEQGRVGDVPDAQLESWAGWEGERGAFARFIRDEHVTDGRINEWDEYQEKLENRRAADRERQRLKRDAARSARHPAEHPQDVRPQSSATRRDETSTIAVTTEAGVDNPVRVRNLVPERHRPAFDVLLLRFGSPWVFCAELEAVAQGKHPVGPGLPPPTWEQIGQGISDYVASGKAAQFPSLVQLRRYVQVVCTPFEAATPPRSSRSGAAVAPVDPESAAAAEQFDKCVGIARGAGGVTNIPAMAYTELAPRTQKALGAVGGWGRLADADEVGLRMKRRDFIGTYLQTSSEGAL